MRAAVLTGLDVPERREAFDHFYDRYRGDALVIDKWFGLQAASQRPGTVAIVEALAKHSDFSMTNPNRLRALAGSFAANQIAFHNPSGRGYRLLADLIVEADTINPQVAARLVPPLGRWRSSDGTDRSHSSSPGRSCRRSPARRTSRARVSRAVATCCDLPRPRPAVWRPTLLRWTRG